MNLEAFALAVAGRAVVEGETRLHPPGYLLEGHHDGLEELRGEPFGRRPLHERVDERHGYAPQYLDGVAPVFQRVLAAAVAVAAVRVAGQERRGNRGGLGALAFRQLREAVGATRLRYSLADDGAWQRLEEVPAHSLVLGAEEGDVVGEVS